MRKKIVAGLHGVPETMLLTLFARANYSRMRGDVFYDAKSVEIADSIDYDFSAAGNDSDLETVTMSRTLLIDQLVKQFIKKNPDAVIINIACGLDTRFFRVDNGLIRWYDVDLPETMSVRKKFFADTNRMKGIAASAMNEEWAEMVDVNSKKTLVIIEGLSMYLGDKAIRKIFSIIHNRFNGAEVLLEIMPKSRLKSHSYSSIKTTKANFSWAADEGKEFVPHGFSWMGDHSVINSMKKVKPMSALWSWMPGMYKNSEKIAVYKKNAEVLKMRTRDREEETECRCCCVCA